MISNVEELLDWSITHFMNGDFEALVACYATPMPVYTTDGIQTHITRDDLIAQFTMLHDTYRKIGVKTITAKVAARGLPRDGRRNYIVDWVYDLGPTAEPLEASITYFCREANRSSGLPLIVEMVEYRQSALEIMQRYLQTSSVTAKQRDV